MFIFELFSFSPHVIQSEYIDKEKSAYKYRQDKWVNLMGKSAALNLTGQSPYLKNNNWTPINHILRDGGESTTMLTSETKPFQEIHFIPFQVYTSLIDVMKYKSF